jgi:hypothetical protein
MTVAISLTESNVFAALRSVLLGFPLTSSDPNCGVAIVRGLVNRVPEPKDGDFIVMWPLSRFRLATNIDAWSDSNCVGSIAAGILTVTSLALGTIIPGVQLFNNVGVNCSIVAQLTQIGPNPGGLGTYSVSAPQANTSSGTIYFGTLTAIQYTDMAIQCDVHGPNSGDNAQIISTLMRDWYGVNAFEEQGFDIQPLYADDPRQIPFINAEQQYEERWSVDVRLQINPIVTVTQQFADALVASTILVEAAFP